MSFLRRAVVVMCLVERVWGFAWSPPLHQACKPSFVLRGGRPTLSISLLRASDARAKLSGPARVAGMVKLEHAYLLAGAATAGSWVACALGALATYKVCLLC